jgi:hypothetical protein
MKEQTTPAAQRSAVKEARKTLHDTQPRRVNIDDETDFQCLHLGATGMSTRFIQNQTGLSPCQVTYRLQKFAIRRMDYRNGTSPIAQEVLKTAAKRTATILRYDLETFGELKVGNGHE